MRLLDVLPPIYRSLLPALDVDAHEERKATCGQCAMTKEGCGALVEERHLFRADTKCCTYHPKLPNYLVGALLADKNLAFAEGRKRVREKIARRTGVVPQWLRPPAKYNFLYDQARGGFGNSESLLCPYHDRGSCSIWSFREAVCSTYHCKHVDGADGRAMWMSLKRYLAIVEHTLSRHALFVVHPDHLLEERDGGKDVLGPEELDDRPASEEAHRATWGAWSGHEAELYVRCFEVVSSLTSAQVDALLGVDGTIASAILEKKRRAAIDPRLPERLKLNPDATIRWLDGGTIAVGAYSELEALELPGEAYPLLVAFRGDTVGATRKRLRDEKSADLDEDTLLLLHQHRVLVEAT